MALLDSVQIVEVGPRDGLQNEASLVPADVKIEFIERLAQAGLQRIEVAAFVSPKRIPQMADSAAVLLGLPRRTSVTYSVLTPNMQGFQAAFAAGASEVAIFASASESFSQHNLNCSIEQSFERFVPILSAAKDAGVRVRGYVSCVLGCPYEGAVKASAVADVARRLFEAGCYEISLGDTIGVGTPVRVKELLNVVSDVVPAIHLAGHFHDTYGQALVNIYASIDSGLRVFDASVSGLGGCPYAPGASGNVATEDLVYMLDGMGFETGVELAQLIAAGEFIRGHLGSKTQSRVAAARLVV